MAPCSLLSCHTGGSHRNGLEKAHDGVYWTSKQQFCTLAEPGMLKLGVHRPDAPVFQTGRIPEDRTAYQLLRTAIPPSEEETRRFESIMRVLRLSGGVYRTTSARRFESLDRFFKPILEARYSAADALWIEDWAASACITSAEWFQDLVKTFPALHMVASDLHVALVEVILPGGDSFVVEADGQPLQYVKPPFVIPLHRQETLRVPVNRWLQNRAWNSWKELQGQGLLDFPSQESAADEWTRPPVRFRRIPMVHPAALSLARTRPAFQVASHSVFEPSPHAGACDVLRCMNIFNRSYFPESRLRQGFSACWQSLKTGGLLLVGRTVEEGQGKPAVHHASVLEKTASGFSLVDRCSEPSEVETVALGVAP